MREPLPDLAAFVAVGNRRSFTAAAAQLGVSPSAVSQAVRKLEERLGTRLLQRTTRSVGLTEEGARFLERLRPALGSIQEAIEELSALRGKPTGTLRIAAPRVASAQVLEPHLAAFVKAHPGLSVEVAVEDVGRDLVEAGFDAGIRLRESIEACMVCVRLGGGYRLAVVGSPEYLRAHGRPRHPRELVRHECIRFRQMPSGEVYDWEFDDRGRPLEVAVKGRLVVNDTGLMIRAAVEGVGLACVLSEQVRPQMARGELVRVLERFCTPFPGLYLYYPSRAQLSTKLRLFIDFLMASLPRR